MNSSCVCVCVCTYFAVSTTPSLRDDSRRPAALGGSIPTASDKVTERREREVTGLLEVMRLDRGHRGSLKVTRDH